MTLHGDRVTCDVPGCRVSVALIRYWPTRRFPRDRHEVPPGWRALPFLAGTAWRDANICPACRARYTDDQLRDMLALQPKETT